MISRPIRFKMIDLRWRDSPSWRWATGLTIRPIRFWVYISQLQVLPSHLTPKRLLEHTHGCAAVGSPKYAPPPTKICAAACPKVLPPAHPATQEHAAAKETPRSSMPTRCPGATCLPASRNYLLPRNSCQNLWRWCLLYTMYCIIYISHIGPGCTGWLYRWLGSTNQPNRQLISTSYLIGAMATRFE